MKEAIGRRWDIVKKAIGDTQLHKVVVVYKGMEMVVCEEV